jgi:hypothetical protein
MMGRVSFDLYAFPAPGPATVAEALQLLEADEAEGSPRFDSDTGERLPRPGPQMAKFIEELERRWPSLDDDPDSPWASWPLWAPIVGGGTGFNIRWSYAASVAPAIVEIAARHNVIIYDPQADQLIQPAPSQSARRLFKRRD